MIKLYFLGALANTIIVAATYFFLSTSGELTSKRLWLLLTAGTAYIASSFVGWAISAVLLVGIVAADYIKQWRER